MAYPAGVLGTYMELYEAEVGTFVEYLRGLSREELQARAEFDGTVVTMEWILRHVAYAGLAYGEDGRGAVQGAEAMKKVKLSGDLVECIAASVPRMAEAMEGAWGKTEAEVSRMMIDTPW